MSKTTSTDIRFTIAQEAREVREDGGRTRTASGRYDSAEQAFDVLDRHRHDWFAEDDHWAPAFVEQTTVTTVTTVETTRVDR